MKVEIKLLDQRLLKLGLKYATIGSAAVDMRACSIEDEPMVDSYTLMPGDTVKIGLGVAIYLGGLAEDGQSNLDADCCNHFTVASLLLPRSGLGSKRIRFANCVGLIDSDYQGQMMATIENASREPYVITPLARIGQMAIVPVLRPDFVVVSEFSQATERGTGGFGSTGTN